MKINYPEDPFDLLADPRFKNTGLDDVESLTSHNLTGFAASF
jgi:hypothetical protein